MHLLLFWTYCTSENEPNLLLALEELTRENYHHDRASPENRVIGRLDSGGQSGEDRAQGTYEELMPQKGI